MQKRNRETILFRCEYRGASHQLKSLLKSLPRIRHFHCNEHHDIAAKSLRIWLLWHVYWIIYWDNGGARDKTVRVCCSFFCPYFKFTIPIILCTSPHINYRLKLIVMLQCEISSVKFQAIFDTKTTLFKSVDGHHRRDIDVTFAKEVGFFVSLNHRNDVLSLIRASK